MTEQEVNQFISEQEFPIEIPRQLRVKWDDGRMYPYEWYDPVYSMTVSNGYLTIVGWNENGYNIPIRSIDNLVIE